MELAGKYAYTPNVFPNQQRMHTLAKTTNNPQLKEAFLNFQYPFRLEDLKSSGYSPKIIEAVLIAAQSSN